MPPSPHGSRPSLLPTALLCILFSEMVGFGSSRIQMYRNLSWRGRKRKGLLYKNQEPSPVSLLELVSVLSPHSLRTASSTAQHSKASEYPSQRPLNLLPESEFELELSSHLCWISLALFMS
ncbi:hypothetical protein LZ31DRAFT_558605 [Colletotrichum somersetense]|nr:hypothetical protein LZ31DRAFT_558605 [Colletotrichum somersetense]